jgi:hypothetical protein
MSRKVVIKRARRLAKAFRVDDADNTWFARKRRVRAAAKRALLGAE